MLEQMKQAYLNELRRNIELEQLNKQLRQELINIVQSDSK